jgi:outer membrane protein assembly factor BamB
MVPALAAQNWPQSYFNAAHTGYNSNETTLSAANVSQLQLQWGSSGPSDGVAGFALDNGVIYAEGFGSTNNLAAIDAATGATLWTVTAGNVGFSYNAPVAVHGGLVYAQCSFVDGSGYGYGAVCAYKKSDGKLIWQWSSPCNCAPEGALNSPMVYANGSIYFGYSDGGCCGSEYFVAADARTGSTLWTYGTGGHNTAGYAAVAVGNGLVYVGCNGNNFAGVCALNQSDGTLSWSTNIGTNSLGLTVGKNQLYVDANFNYEIVALNATTGTTAWTFTTDGTDYPVALAKNVVYARGSNSELNAVNAKTGANIWSDTPQNISSSPSVANGVIYVGQSGNNWPAASAFDATNGSLLWSSPGGAGYGYVAPVVANGVLYIANAPCGAICAYHLADSHHRN